MGPRMRRLLLGFCVAFWATAAGALEVEFEEFFPSDGSERPWQQFGWYGRLVPPDVVLVGAPNASESDRRSATGAVYVFERSESGWSETKLVPSDVRLRDRVGTTLGVLGDDVFVGYSSHSGFDIAAGAVWVFRRAEAGWVEQDKLIGSSVHPWAGFGTDLDVSDTQVLIGANGLDGAAGEDVGAVFVFERDGDAWVEVQKIVPSDALAFDRFGGAIGVDGDIAVLGSDATWKQTPVPSRGVAYVYRFDGSLWVEEARLEPDRFLAGYGRRDAVAVSGDSILLGVPHGRASSISAGYAVTYRYDGAEWVEEARLHPSDGVAGDGFGHSVALQDDLALVASRTHNPDGTRGAVYVFRLEGSEWAEHGKLERQGPEGFTLFGARVRLREGHVFVGHTGGRAYVGRLFESMRVDVLPGRDPSAIDPLSRRPIPVAIFGGPDFEPRDLRWSSLRLGPGGAASLLPFPLGRLDLDEDGFRDAVALFGSRESAIAVGDTEACVTGELEGEALPFRGCDVIETGSRCGAGFEAAWVAPVMALAARRGRRWRRESGGRAGRRRT